MASHTFLSYEKVGDLLMVAASDLPTQHNRRLRLQISRTIVNALRASKAIDGRSVLSVGIGVDASGTLGIIVSQDEANAGS